MKRTTKTYTVSAKELRPTWHLLNADGVVLGRLATQIAAILRGKHRPDYSPHLDMREYVVVVNAAKVRVTGNKLKNKVYYRHSQYPGGLKSINLAKLLATHPTRVIEYAVWGMLPHNRLGRKLMRHLKVYAGPHHPHEAQLKGFTASPPRGTEEAP